MRLYGSTCTLAIAMAAIATLAGAQSQPVLRPIATLPGVTPGDFAVMPNGRVLYYLSRDTLYAWDLAAKRAVFVERGRFDDFSVSPRGDRIVFDRENEDRTATHIWTLPVNSVTGAARGPAQRVSTREGHEPRVSPDGGLIAFVSPVDSSPDLVVVPATGGPERVVARFNVNLSYVDWTADGKWILVHLPATTTGPAMVQRVSVSGGVPETLFSVPAANGFNAAFDGEFALFRTDRQPPSTGRVSYRGPAGEQGVLQIPPTSWMRIDPVNGRTRRYAITTTQSIAVNTINVADGARKPVLSTAGTSRVPFFSPDGRRLAMQTSTNGHFDLTIIDTDGAGQRTFILPFEPDWPLMRWSPDSRRLAFWANGRSALTMLDATTGETKVMNEEPGALGGIIWARNSRSIRFWRFRPSGARTLYDVTIDGTLRTLRDFPATMRTRGFFITDELVEYATADADYVFSLESGQSRRLPVAGQALAGMPSSDGRWLAFLITAGPGRRGQIQIMTAGGDSSRVLDLPFETYRGAPQPNIVFSPDNRHVFMVGRRLGQQALILFDVPLNGGTPREIAQLPGEVPYDHMDLSPDGRTMAYPVQGPPTTTIYELDLSPLKRTASRPN